jgi:hypothetical protein
LCIHIATVHAEKMEIQFRLAETLLITSKHLTEWDIMGAGTNPEEKA